MLSLQTYPETGRYYRQSFLEESGKSTISHARHRKNSNDKGFYADSFRDKSDGTKVASMAMAILSTSPDIASSLIHQYFRSEGMTDKVCQRLSSCKITLLEKSPEQADEQKDQISCKETPRTVTKSCLKKSDKEEETAPRKCVKFADDDGRPLAVVKEFQRFDYFESLREDLFQNSLPNIPFDDGHMMSLPIATPPSPPHSHKNTSASSTASAKFVCDFPIPSQNYAQLTDKVKRNMVSLENILVSDNRVAGSVRVLNHVFEKRVFVRYTTDQWRTHREVACRFVNNELTGAMTEMDSFAFDFTGPTPDKPEHEIRFCVRYEAGNDEFWDNNDGEDYAIVTAEFVRLRNKVREEEERSTFRFDL